MTEWQLIDESTPRGRIKKHRKRHPKTGVVITKVFAPDWIEVVGDDRVIRISHWMPARKAWEFYGVKNPPKYWRPLPDLPEEYR